MGTRDNRFVAFLVAATFAYVLMEATVRTLIEKRARFMEWRTAFVGQFERHPGRREWLRDTLRREEQTVRARATEPCEDCPDGD